jgi:hypothetical protein
MSADTAIRMRTAAAGLHPACSSDVANVPDVPKVAADSAARARPAPEPAPEPVLDPEPALEPGRKARDTLVVTAILL